MYGRHQVGRAKSKTTKALHISVEFAFVIERHVSQKRHVRRSPQPPTARGRFSVEL
jgi:hypothetical protein